MSGMQTSTEDILLAYTLLHHSHLFPSIPHPSQGEVEGCSASTPTPVHYADLGCGIGSTLLVVDYWLRPKISVGAVLSRVIA